MWSDEKNREPFTAFKMEVQNWVGSLHDNMMKVLEVEEAKEQADGAGRSERGDAPRDSARLQGDVNCTR